MLTKVDTILEAGHLTREVNGKAIVRDVSFEVARAELLAIVGPSGSGKSSLLRLLNRLDEPTGGSVRLNGEDYRAIRPRELRRRVGLVMQRPYLFPGTVAANVRFGPQQRGEALDDPAVDALLERVELGGFGARTVDKLSGGEAQRVSIARTLANRPEVLLLDEPTSALDETLARRVEDLIAGIIQQEHLTCLMVTHNRAQARRMADRVLLVERGAVAGIGAAKEMIDASETPA
jgi:putative ABC transport system ATP-binding protein